LHGNSNLIVVIVEIEVSCDLICLCSFSRPFARRACAVSFEESSRERTPWNQRYTLINAKRNHLTLFFAVNEVIVVLHGDEPMPAVLLGGIKRFGKLPRRHTASAEVAHFPSTH